MITTLEFGVRFHTPFRIGAAHAQDGVDLAVDRGEPLGASHLKGLMRAAATHTLGVGTSLVNDIFGSAQNQAPWAWAPAQPEGSWGEPSRRHRVHIDPVTHTAFTDGMLTAHQMTTAYAWFSISQTRPIDDGRLEKHKLVLRCSAAAVHGIGGWRRRGYGWVGIAPQEPVTRPDIVALRWLTGTTHG